MANIKAEKRPEIVMYSQFQPCWSTVGVLPCMEQINSPPIPAKIGEFYKTSSSHPWRPMLGYELMETAPLQALPVTNLLVDACRTPCGMTTEPLKFPNLITGFDCNPSHAARAALSTRYTPYDWTQSQIRLYNEANKNRKYSETLRMDAIRLMKETDEKVQEGQLENEQKVGERITDITFWRKEVASELEKFITEDDKMQKGHHGLRDAIQSFEGQLHIAQECLYHRESRKGIDLVHDEVEYALMKEIETIKNCEKRLEQFLDKCVDQLTNNRTMQHQLRSIYSHIGINIQNKEMVLGIDTVCHQMNNFSRGLRYYGGIEKYDRGMIETESWMEASNKLIKKSQAERTESCQLRDEIDSAMKLVDYEIIEVWNNTIKALERRVVEMLEAKGKLEIHLHKVRERLLRRDSNKIATNADFHQHFTQISSFQKFRECLKDITRRDYKIQQEIFGIEKSMELIQKTIADKSTVLKVAHTRLEARTPDRAKSELCKEHTQLSLIQEVKDINKIVHDMNLKLQQFEAQHQQLLHTRSNLESDLRSKVDALFIDREKCIGLRRSYPILSNIRF